MQVTQPLTSTLFRRLLPYYLLVSTGMLVLVAAVEYTEVRDRTLREIRAHAYRHAAPLAEALWEMDRRKIEAVAASVNGTAVVAGVAVYDHQRDQVMVSVGHSIGGELVGSFPAFHVFTLPLDYAHESGSDRVGYLSLLLARSQVFTQMLPGMVVLTSGILVMVSLLWLGLVYFGRTLVTRPLEKLTFLTHRLETAGLGKEFPPRPGDEVNELDALEDAFFIMARRVQQARDEIERNNQALERRVAEKTARLRASEERFELALRGANDGLWDWRLQTGEVYYSPRWCEMLGYGAGELAPTLETWSKLVDPADSKRVHRLARDYIEGRTDGFVTEFRMRHRDGSWVDILSRGHLGWADGQPVRLVGTHVDITERKRHEKALEDANASLERQVAERTQSLTEANEAKSVFLANMSHEIRTPLNGVLGLARIGLRETRETGSGERFKHILDLGNHLLGVLNDILDFSRIEANKMTIVSSPLRLMDLLDRMTGLVAERAADKGLSLDVDVERDLPAWFEGDEVRVQQVLLNLLTNAIKFTEEGGVSLRVRRRADGTIGFDVGDTGIGLVDEELARLFSPFEQADGSTTRKYGGSGLGLSISRDLARLMGGDILVESIQGEGSVFTLVLPLSEAAAPPVTTADSQNPGDTQRLDGLTLLVAEDVEINRLIIEDLLVEEGASIVFAHNGQEAVDRVAEMRTEEFDVVLMDIQMPVMDGYEATRRITDLVPDLPVIGVTAHALREERDKCLQHGMVDHIGKPVQPDELVSVILRHAR